MSGRAIQDGWVMEDSSDKTWSPGEGNGKLFQYSWLENLMNSKKKKVESNKSSEMVAIICSYKIVLLLTPWVPF